MRKSTKIISILLVTILLLASIPLLTASAEEEGRVVRVGYMNHPGYIERTDNGQFVGLGVEFLREVCKYTGWTIEYVYASWAEQLEMLKTGELDLVPMVQFSHQRAEEYNFSHQPVGLIQGMLVTLPIGQNDIGTDVASCDGATIGVLRGSRNIELLSDYAQYMGFTYTAKEYDFQAELEEALLSKEVDLIACEQMAHNDPNFRVIDRFASDPYYYISTYDKEDLMTELDNVISMINAYDSNYMVRLHQKYFGSGLASSRPYFTKDETEYIRENSEVTLVLIPDNQPLAYLDKQGNTVGIIPDIMDRVSALCGITFNYVYLPKDTTPLAYLRANPTYFGTGMLANNPAFSSEDIVLSDTYYSTHAALAINKQNVGKYDYKTEKHTIGIPTSFQALHSFLATNYPNLEICDYMSVEDALRALEEGEVDFFAYTIGLITPYLANPLFSDIAIVENRFMPCPLCTVATVGDGSEQFISIFNKCIAMIPDVELAQMEADYLREGLYHFNDRDALLRYQSHIMLTGLVITFVVIALLGILFYKQRKFNRQITQHAEYDTMTGLYNRVTMKARSIRALEEHKDVRCALLVFGIDDVRRINETDGQKAGDDAIKAVADIVKQQFAGDTIMGRVAGDSFAVLLCGIESKSLLVSILTKLQRSVAAASVPSLTSSLSISIGVAIIDGGECDAEELYRRADEARNCVRLNGKNGFAFYSPQRTMSYRAISKTDNGEYIVETQDDTSPVDTISSDSTALVRYDSDFERLIESFPNVAVYVIERDSHKILYFNRRFREICPKVTIGMSCRNIMLGPCQNCIVDTMGEQAVAHCIFHSDYYGGNIEITATKIMWQNETPAVMISTWPRSVLTSSNDRLPGISNRDSLDYVTGGLTRYGFINMMERMRAGDVSLADYAVLFINIQDFKAVNEMVGSDGGDSVLRALYTRVEQSELQPIIGARKESDHFLFLVEKSALDLDKLPDLLNFSWQYGGKDLFILCRCGVFYIEDPDLEVFKMIDRAKLAKEHIVDEYIRPYAVYQPFMLNEYSDRAEAFILFDKGIKNNEFVVFYQPVMDARTQKIIGAEALVRKKTEDGGIVSPGKFIPILERTGYISKLDDYVGEAVKAFQRARADAGLPIVPISFNLSQKDFYDADFIENLVAEFESDSFPRGSILLEVTESAYTLNEKKNEELLKRLRDAGAKILLDDFGTGYSSFGMFENYNFDRVKLDMSFVRQLSANSNVRQVVKAIIVMCHDLGVTVVAEGVETAEELSILQGMGCDYIQGYYFSKPLDEESFVRFVEKHL